MGEQEVVQIKVGSGPVGILGLKEVLEEMAGPYADRPDEEVREGLLKRLGKRNYIPGPARDQYASAFLREFKKHLGLEVEEGPGEGLEVLVLGAGCTQCDGLEREVMAVLSELSLAGNVEHIRDVKEIGKYGVMGTPALLINGKVKAVGRVPPRARLVQWLKEAAQSK